MTFVIGFTFIVDWEYCCSGQSSHHVCRSSSEKRFPSSFSMDSFHTFPSTWYIFSLKWAHHHAPSDCIKGIRASSRNYGGYVAQRKSYQHILFLLMWQQWSQWVIDAKVESSVNYHTETGHWKSSIKTCKTLTFASFQQTVCETVKLLLNLID